MSDGAAATDDGDTGALIGRTLASRYQIESLLGEGAMGVVYKARHVKVGRPFAVKVLHKRLLEDHKVAQRFEREAELAGRLHHPNVIGVVDVGMTPDGTQYMVMDFAAGEDLAALLVEAPMAPERIIHLSRQLLEGLYHAHEAGLIHRDLKPENVIIERDDHGSEVPRIVDFGIAILREGGDSSDSDGRLTTNGLVLGTPHYMAPEQAVADPIDHRIDLFALGIVIYEMLCGKLPFDGSGAEVARANLLLDPPAIATRVPYLEVDPLLEAYARLLMQKKREDRPATAKVARELLDLIGHDRDAAAKQLGVTLVDPAPPGGGAETRGQAASLEVAKPTAPSPPLEGSGPEASEPPAASEAAEAVPASPRSLVRATSTDVAIPLRFTDGSATKQSRSVMIAIGVGVVVLGFALWAGLDVKKHSVPPSETVVMATAVPPPITEPAPTPTATATPPTAETTAAGSATAPPASELAAGSGEGSASAASATAPDPDPRPSKLPRPKQPNGTHEIQKPVATTKPNVVPTPTTPVASLLTSPLTAKSVSDHYRRAGAAIARLQKSSGDDAVSDLWTRYRRIQIQSAVRSPAAMAAADQELAKIEHLVTSHQ